MTSGFSSGGVLPGRKNIRYRMHTVMRVAVSIMASYSGFWIQDSDRKVPSRTTKRLRPKLLREGFRKIFPTYHFTLSSASRTPHPHSARDGAAHGRSAPAPASPLQSALHGYRRRDRGDRVSPPSPAHLAG